MKNRLNISSFVFSVAASLLLLAGCTKDYIEDIVTQKGFEVQLNITNSSVVDTRSAASTGECFIAKGYVFAFDPTSGVQKASCALTTSNITGNGTTNPKISASVTVNKGDIVVFVFNQSISGGDGNLGNVTRSNLQEYFTMSGPKVLYSASVAGSGLPMYGEITWGTVGLGVTIARSVAKLQVQLPTTDGNLSGGLSAANDVTGCFTAARVSYQLHNYTNKGTINPGHHSTEKGSETSYLPVSKAGDNVRGVNYMYAFPYSHNIVEGSSPVTIEDSKQDPRRLALILKHTTVSAGVGYYRVDLCNGDPLTKDLKYLDVEGNMHYKINITKVKSHGYLTVEDALANSASNLEYEIVDDSGDHTVSNGQYAITMEGGLYSHVLYRAGETIVDEAMKIKYVTHDGSALATLPKTVITHVVPAGLTVTSNDVTDLTTTFQSLNFTITGEGKGDIVTTIKFGNLTYVHKFYVDKTNTPLDCHVSSMEIDGQLESGASGVIDGWTIENIAGGKVKVTSPDNVTPVSWKLMNSSGGYDVVADGSHVDAIPSFEPKTLRTRLNFASGGSIRVVVEQLAPFYIGRWGSPEVGVQNGTAAAYASLYTNTMGNPLRKRAVVEAVEEKRGNIKWGPSLMTGADVNMANHGLHITNLGGTDGTRPALHECWKKNASSAAADRRWYLPAQNQLRGVWTALNEVGYSGVSMFSSIWYWTASEFSDIYSWSMEFSGGDMNYLNKTNGRNVRCVRDL